MAEKESNENTETIKVIEVSVKEISNDEILIRTGTTNQIVVMIPKFTIST